MPARLCMVIIESVIVGSDINSGLECSRILNWILSTHLCILHLHHSDIYVMCVC